MKNITIHHVLFIFAALFIIVWSVSGAIITGNSAYFFTLALAVIVLLGTSMIPIRLLFKWPMRKLTYLITSAFLIWLLLIPIIWIFLIEAILLIYAYAISTCCEQSNLLNNGIWFALQDTYYNSPLVFPMHWSILIYISVLLHRKVLNNNWLIWFPKSGIIVGVFMTLVGIYHAFTTI